MRRIEHFRQVRSAGSRLAFLLSARFRRRAVRALFPDVFDVINRAAGFASANRDKERTVRRHSHVRWRETVRADGFEKNFRLCFVAAAVRLEREKVNLAEGPIQNEQTVAIAFRKLVVPIAGHACWRTASDRPENINCVRVIIGPVPTPFPAVQSPAVMTAKRDLIEPRRRVPGQEEIALHVAVVREDVAEPVEIEVVRVAETVRDDFRIPAIRRQAQQASRFRLANRRVRQRIGRNNLHGMKAGAIGYVHE